LAACASLVASVAAAGSAGPRSGDEPPFLTAADFIAAGLPVPGTHPTLPICPRGLRDSGFRSRADARRARDVIDLDAPAVCQADRTFGVFQLRP
jgi:hypothetical protein